MKFLKWLFRRKKKNVPLPPGVYQEEMKSCVYTENGRLITTFEVNSKKHKCKTYDRCRIQYTH